MTYILNFKPNYISLPDNPKLIPVFEGIRLKYTTRYTKMVSPVIIIRIYFHFIAHF